MRIDAKQIGKFAQKSQSFAAVGLPIGARQGVQKAALVATTAARASIAAGSGGDSALSNVGRKGGARVGARYDIKGAKNPTALVRATGPLHLLDNPTVPHLIKARGYRMSRSKKSRESYYNMIFGGSATGAIGSAKNATPMRTPFGPRYYVQHPGTRGKRTFWRGIDAARPLIPLTFRTEVSRAMVRHFK